MEWEKARKISKTMKQPGKKTREKTPGKKPGKKLREKTRKKYPERKLGRKTREKKEKPEKKTRDIPFLEMLTTICIRR
jgi:hypothetical protein